MAYANNNSIFKRLVTLASQAGTTDGRLLVLSVTDPNVAGITATARTLGFASDSTLWLADGTTWTQIAAGGGGTVSNPMPDNVAFGFGNSSDGQIEYFSGTNLFSVASVAPAAGQPSAAVQVGSGPATGAGVSGAVTLKSSDADAGTGALALSTGLPSPGVASGAITVASGNVSGAATSGTIGITSGTGTTTGSGLIQVVTGTVTTGTSGLLRLRSGGASGAGTSGQILVGSGDSSGGTSGESRLYTGTGSTGSGDVNVFTGGALGATGAIAIFSGFSAGAASGSVNIISGGSSTDSGIIGLGSGTATGAGNSGAVSIASGQSASGSTGATVLASGDSSAAGITGQITVISGTTTGAGTSGAVGLQTGASATGTTGNITLTTGSTSGAGTSGNITLTTGTVVGGTRGSIVLNARSLTPNVLSESTGATSGVFAPIMIATTAIAGAVAESYTMPFQGEILNVTGMKTSAGGAGDTCAITNNGAAVVTVDLNAAANSLLGVAALTNRTFAAGATILLTPTQVTSTNADIYIWYKRTG